MVRAFRLFALVLGTLFVTVALAASVPASAPGPRTGRGAYHLGDALPVGLDVADGSHFIVAFDGPIASGARATLDAHALVYDYLPSDAFLVAGERSALAALPGVRAVEPYAAAFKLAPSLPSSGSVDLALLVWPDTDLLTAVGDIAFTGAHVTSFTEAQAEGVVKATVDASVLPALARLPAVSWIEPAYDGITLDNEKASAITQTGATGNWNVNAKGVDGSSQKLSICDTGVETTTVGPNVAALPKIGEMKHEMYNDPSSPLVFYNQPNPLSPPLPAHRKVALYYSPTENGQVMGDFQDADSHGTHTAGTLAGDAPNSLGAYGTRDNHDGVAYAAKLVICDITTGSNFNILNDYSNYWKPAYDAGARVNSNSWGSPHTNDYTEKARQHDLYAWDHRDFLVVRSAGNTGPGGPLRPESVAKDAMATAASENAPNNIEDLASFSTQGPAADGRIKPDFTAPGDCLMSAQKGTTNGYVCLSGTSMSTPTASGAAGLVRDYFSKGYYPSGAANGNDSLAPSSALVRAVLYASGHALTGAYGGPVPSRSQGWGRITLDDALYFAGDAKKLYVADEGAGLSTGGSQTTSLAIGAGQPLRVMVVWTDRAAAAGANPALVNDLDVVVKDPSGNTYLGNAFVGSQVLPNQGVADHRNVEEAVYVNAPAAGTWTVTVSGFNVPSGPQPFALVATFG